MNLVDGQLLCCFDTVAPTHIRRDLVTFLGKQRKNTLAR